MLNDSKGTIGHGDWLNWLKVNCQLSERTSQRYMNMAMPDNKRKIETWLRTLKPGQASLNKAVAQITVRKTRPPKPSTEQYDKAEETLIDKLRNLEPNSIEAAAAETIRQLNDVVARMKPTKAAA